MANTVIQVNDSSYIAKEMTTNDFKEMATYIHGLVSHCIAGRPLSNTELILRNIQWIYQIFSILLNRIKFPPGSTGPSPPPFLTYPTCDHKFGSQGCDSTCHKIYLPQ